jgi:hypothetical protein
MSNRNYANGRAFYAMHVKPVLIDCNFIVDSSNGNGLGIRSLKGPMVNNVFMHTSATPGSNNGMTNPNPSTGIIVVQLQDNFNRYYGGFSGQIMGVGSPTATIVAGNPYVITVLGTTTAAQWQAAGVPASMMTNNGLPNIGLSFIAAESATIPGSPSVNPPVASGIDHIEIIGDPNQSIAPNPALAAYAPNQGAQLIMQCQFEGVATAPANGTVIGLAFYLSDSSIQVQGE